MVYKVDKIFIVFLFYFKFGILCQHGMANFSGDSWSDLPALLPKNFFPCSSSTVNMRHTTSWGRSSLDWVGKPTRWATWSGVLPSTSIRTAVTARSLLRLGLLCWTSCGKSYLREEASDMATPRPLSYVVTSIRHQLIARSFRGLWRLLCMSLFPLSLHLTHSPGTMWKDEGTSKTSGQDKLKAPAEYDVHREGTIEFEYNHLKSIEYRVIFLYWSN